MREDDIPSTLNRVEQELIKMKSAQRITSDSWKLYRYKGEAVPTSSPRQYLVFRSYNPNILATVRLDQDFLGFELYPTGIIADEGIHFFALPKADYDPAFPLEWGITSTQPGSVNIETEPPI